MKVISQGRKKGQLTLKEFALRKSLMNTKRTHRLSKYCAVANNRKTRMISEYKNRAVPTKNFTFKLKRISHKRINVCKALGTMA
jgi:ribosomal protein L32